MKKIHLFFLLCTLISLPLKAQDYHKQIEAFKKSFEEKSPEKLNLYLGSEFTLPTITKQQLPIALNQLFTQLPLISLETKEKLPNKALIAYEFERLGKKTSFVHFNDKGKITRIELFENLINTSIERRNAKPNPDKVLAKKHPSRKVTFATADHRTVFGELYETGKNLPIILLCHQSGFNKYEYAGIAPILNELRFNCLAVDLTTGGTFQEKPNETIQNATTPIDRNSMAPVDAAEKEIAAAIKYLSEKYKKKVVVWGSSNSATLCLLAAAKNEQISAIIAFSAFDHFRENRTSLSEIIPTLDQPIFMTSAKGEAVIISKILKDISLKKNQVHFIPEGNGDHGSKVIWNGRPDAKEYWNALKFFLNKVK